MYIYWRRSKKTYDKLFRYLLKYDVISFDIFDTVVIRICNTPKDVFEIVSKEAELFGIYNFTKIRIKAQELTEAEKGISTNLKSIYKTIKKICGLTDEQIKKLQNLEVQTEAKLCIPNATIISLISDLKQHGKKILFTSDMYLDSNMINEIFASNKIGIIYDKLYISCEEKKSKAIGDLFDYIKKQFPCNKIIHVGDYWRSDIYSALKNGRIDAVYYPLAGKYKGQYELFRKNSISEKENYIYKWAYKEFAPVLWNFCEWIYIEAKKNSISELLFLTREGAFIQKLFEIYNHDEKISTQVFYASRRSLLCASSDINWDWIKKTLGNASVAFLLKAFHLNNKKFKRETLSKNIKDWAEISEVKTDIENYSKSQRVFLLQYIDGLIKGVKRIGLVDVGWKGSSQYFLTKIFSKEKRDINIFGFYLGEFYNRDYQFLDKTGYLCSTFNTAYKEDVLNAGFIFENLLSPEFGTTEEYAFYNNKVHPVLEDVNKKNGVKIQVAQKAIIDYFIQYANISTFCPHPNKDKTIELLFKSLENPTYKMAVELGNISYVDFGKLYYVAKPKALIYYLLKPKEFAYDFKHCGWNSAFCKRCFRLPLPYFKIYKFLKRLIKVD